MSTTLESADPTIAYQLWLARAKQDSYIELSESRNYVSATAWQAAGLASFDSATAYEIGHQESGIEDVAGTVERVACTRACTLFGAGYASLRAHSLGRANHLVVLSTTKPGDTVVDIVRHTQHYVAYELRMNMIGQLESTNRTPIDAIDGHPDYRACEAVIGNAVPSLVRFMPHVAMARVDFGRLSRIVHAADGMLAVDLSYLAASIAARRVASPLGLADLATVPTHGSLRGPRGALLLAAARCREALGRTVRTYCSKPPPLRVLATQAVALKEALREEFAAYHARVIESAEAMRRVLQERGVSVIADETRSHVVVIECAAAGVAAEPLIGMLARAHLNVERDRTGALLDGAPSSGRIALSTAAITARGLGLPEAQQIAHMVADIVLNAPREETANEVRQRVIALCTRYPVEASLNA